MSAPVEVSRGLVIVDVETTGLTPADICVEVGWHDLRTGESGSFVPSHDVTWVLENAHPKALEVNGYRERLVDAKQDVLGIELDALHRRLRGQVMGGSNVRTDAAHMARLFDVASMVREPWHYHLAELSSYACGVLRLPITDPPGLWTCCELLGVEPESDVHTAAGGASATARCFEALFAVSRTPSTEGTEA